MKRICPFILAFLVLVLLSGVVASAGSAATDLLLAKARSLEGRGRLDLAAQSWQQVLMADPNQPEALAGLARWAKQNGQTEEAQQYLDRLRKVDPNDPEIARIQALKIIGPKQRARLQEAGRLAGAHQYEDSMRLYREVLGDNPPPGDWAIAYYETEAATADGYPAAVVGLRRLAQQFPSDMQYRLCLGRLLTYRPASRMEGARLLASIPPSSAETGAAREAWRQALVWEGATPAVVASLREYLKRYPDPELATYLKKAEQTQTGVATVVRSREEQLGYEALNANNLPEAEAQFQAVLKRDPRSAGALAGLGYVHMKQQDFAGAVKYFEAAKAVAPGESRIGSSLETARFWELMQQGSNALATNQIELAQSYFQQAVTLRPKNAEALQGYAGTLMKQGEARSAIAIYLRMTESAPENLEGWRGLLRAQMQAGDTAGAAQTVTRIPSSTRSSLARDLDFLTLEASVYAAAGQDDEVQKLVQQAVLIANAQPLTLTTDIRLELAGLLLQNGQSQQAVGIYLRVTESHPENVDAWQGLVAAYLQQHDNPRAIAVLQHMPKTAYDSAIQKPGFLLSIASVYEAQGQHETAEEFVLRAMQIESKEGHEITVTTQLALANIWLAEGRNDEANKLLRPLIEKNPDSAEAWKGYIAALHQEKNDAAALGQSEQLPDAVAQRLKNDTGYLSLMAAVNAGVGQYDEALRLLKQAMFHYELARQPVPVDLEVQLGWLLLDSQTDERELYKLLVGATSRRDLSNAQRRDFEGIWAAWSLRQAEAARLGGDIDREITILEAALRALPFDNQVRGSLASALLQKGDIHRSYALYKAWGLKGGDVNDYRGAIGAAMTLHEDAQEEAWLREALRQWPSNPQVLMLAASVAQDHGDFDKAKRYWQQALRSLPADQNQQLSGLPGVMPAAPHDGRSMQDLARTLMPGEQLPDPNSTSSPLPPPLTVSPAPQFVIPQPASDMPSPSTTPSKPTSKNVPQGSRHSKPAATTLGGSPAATSIRPISQVSVQPGGAAESANDPQDETAAQAGVPQPGTLLPPPAQLLPAYPAANSAAEAPSAQSYVAGQQSQREEIEAQIAAIEGRNSPFLGVGGLISDRSGQAGFERLMDQEADLEASIVVNQTLRLTAVARPVFLDSGVPDGTSAYRFGTAPVGAIFASQSTSGLAGEIQLSTENFGLRLGASPTGFPVYNWLGGTRWRIGGGPITVLLNRDNVNDTLMSYAGAPDPAPGVVWGGVMANTAALQGNWGGAGNGLYGSMDYQLLQGKNVAQNYRIAGDAGAYWRIVSRPYGSLTIGANMFAMHYNKDLRYFTLGQGGYFSPQEYFLFNTPIRWVGNYKRDFEYSISGSLGSQQFHEDTTPFFPNNPGLQGNPGPYYPSQTVTSVNYNFSFRGDYRLPGSWYLGAFVNFNNARDYAQQTFGFNVRYLFNNAPMTPETPVPTIPDWRGFHPFRLPE